MSNNTNGNTNTVATRSEVEAHLAAGRDIVLRSSQKSVINTRVLVGTLGKGNGTLLKALDVVAKAAETGALKPSAVEVLGTQVDEVSFALSLQSASGASLMLAAPAEKVTRTHVIVRPKAGYAYLVSEAQFPYQVEAATHRDDLGEGTGRIGEAGTLDVSDLTFEKAGPLQRAELPEALKAKTEKKVAAPAVTIEIGTKSVEVEAPVVQKVAGDSKFTLTPAQRVALESLAKADPQAAGAFLSALGAPESVAEAFVASLA